MTYGIVGRGKMARHFSNYLQLKGLPHKIWNRDMGTEPSEALRDCEILLILISDDAIVPWIERQKWIYPPTQLVHFSGRLSTPLAIGIHPLSTFGPTLYGLSTYEKIFFISEVGRPGFADIFPHLVNPTAKLDPNLKAFYHSICSMAGNFTVLLWQKAFEDFTNKLGLPKESLVPFLEQICTNLKTKPATALTGPLSRGDVQTLHAHMEALSGDSYQSVYRAFVKAYDPKIEITES